MNDTQLTPPELEPYLKYPIDYFVTHTRKETYEAILAVIASTSTPTAVGYHPAYGWFVLANDYNSEAVSLLWSQKKP